VATAGHGYIEDRRPGANADPYEVSTRILETVWGARVERAATAMVEA
jgi:glutamine synthetase